MRRFSHMLCAGSVLLGGACRAASPAPIAAPTSAPTSAPNALADIVGVWQSDTTGGVSALSSCEWSPHHLAVVCDQRIMMEAGERHVTNVYAVSSGSTRYVFYGLAQPGGVVHPVPLAIDAHVWLYGDMARDDRGMLHRIVNDFTARNAYTWRAESSTDGVHWTTVAHGRSTRVGG